MKYSAKYDTSAIPSRSLAKAVAFRAEDPVRKRRRPKKAGTEVRRLPADRWPGKA